MRKRSIMLAVATVLATAYVVWMFCTFIGGTASAENGAEALGGVIATAMITPHMVMFFLGAVFGWVGLIARMPWAALVGAILYSVGTVFFLLYALFGVPILVFGFIGFANQKKINKKLLALANPENPQA